MTSIYHIKLSKSNIDVWAKLELENPTGTHKDRSITPWIDYYRKQGVQEFAIASSGNSARSATEYCRKNGLKLDIFISKHSASLSRLEEASKSSGNILLNIGKNPRREAIEFCRGKDDIINLRASTDDNALIGYKQITIELKEQLEKIDNIFVPTSSGATLEGIYNGFAEEAKDSASLPAFFVVQTSKVNPIASHFDKDFTIESHSHAGAIVDRIAHRRSSVIKICEETNGGGFVVSNSELKYAHGVLQSSEGQFGWHSALAFAGFLKWHKKNPEASASKTSVCIFTD
jgi:threonine synthase